MRCETCNKEFKTQRALNAHQIAHKTGNRYSLPRSKSKETHVCLNCNLEFTHSNSTYNKFCSTTCSQVYQWEKVSVPKILAGQGGNYKRYLFETRGEKCEECGQLPEHNGKPLTLQLDHIDGNSDNNNLSNLRILCPNCHTQTHTYGSKGNGNRYKKSTKRNLYLQKYKAGLV